MNCAEAYVRFLYHWLLDNCYEDMEFMTKFIDNTAIQRLEMVAKSKFHRITYTEAVAILEEAAKVRKFENKVEWGIDIASEHERYLTNEKFKAPFIVYNYPKAIKAFYMKVNDDNKTVAAMDVLVPKVGELVGGSQREENYGVLKERILEMGLPLERWKPKNGKNTSFRWIVQKQLSNIKVRKEQAKLRDFMIAEFKKEINVSLIKEKRLLPIKSQPY